jgi:tetratricopeptide (TPR) repeat protein
VAAGYVPEAASTVGRLQSLQRVIRQVREDPSGEAALGLLTGAQLRDLDPEGWQQAREAMEAHLTQMPGMTTVSAGSTVRPGLGFAGQREPQREAVLGSAALVALANVAGDAFLVLRGEYAPTSLKKRLHKFRSDAIRRIELADEVLQAATEPASDTEPVGTEPTGASPAPHPRAIRAVAALTHAQTLRMLGDHAGARRQLEEAIDAEDPHLTATAQFQLGNACRDLGDFAAARKAYEAAAETGLDISASAAYNLGHLLATLDPPASKAAYAQAMELDPIESGPKAAVNLGIALAGDGNAESARRAFQWAIDSEHPVQRAKALVNLAQLTVASGDVAGAVRLLEEAIDADIADATSQALLIRGDLHLSAHEADDAALAYARAVDCAASHFSGEAALRLAHLERQAGRDEDARGRYEQAVNLGPEAVAVRAAEALSTLDS